MPAGVTAQMPEADAPAVAAEPRTSIHFGMFGRSPAFTRRQWRVFGIVASAGFFDNYDRALLSLALTQIQRALRIAEASLGTVLSVIRLGYLLALLITPIADVVGRRRLLLYTIVGYTVFTGLSAIAPDARTFTACQLLTRAFAGAEGTVALVIVTEEVDAGVRGWAIGLLSALASVGYGIAALAFAGINVVPYGWRGLYALALIPLVLIIPLRRVLPESRRFERESAAGLRPRNILVPLRALFAAYPGRLIMLVTVAFLGNLGGNAAGILFPKYLQEAHGWSPGQVTELFPGRRDRNSRQYHRGTPERSFRTAHHGIPVLPACADRHRIDLQRARQSGDTALDIGVVLRYRVDHDRAGI